MPQGSRWNQTMQLVLTPQERESLNNLVGKKSQRRRRYFSGAERLHHTPLLLDNIFSLNGNKVKFFMGYRECY